jgi:peptidylprolyl isomerase
MSAVSRGPIAIVSVCVALAAAVAGCGSTDSSSTGGSSTPTGSEASSEVGKKKPKVEVPSGAPPKQLEKTELVEGSGAEAKAGDEVTVQYVGVNYGNGRQFDASWDRGEPFTFTLGAGQVIPGWEEGIPGMKAGGRRELTIPPELAYGAAGSPPAIGPNETLIFVIDLLSVE